MSPRSLARRWVAAAAHHAAARSLSPAVKAASATLTPRVLPTRAPNNPVRMLCGVPTAGCATVVACLHASLLRRCAVALVNLPARVAWGRSGDRLAIILIVLAFVAATVDGPSTARPPASSAVEVERAARELSNWRYTRCSSAFRIVSACCILSTGRADDRSTCRHWRYRPHPSVAVATAAESTRRQARGDIASNFFGSRPRTASSLDRSWCPRRSVRVLGSSPRSPPHRSP